MLTDVFSTRYRERPIWNSYGEAERTLLIQCFRNVSEQVIPYWLDKKVDEPNKELWERVESRLSMELGMQELSPHIYGYYNNYKAWISGSFSMEAVCKSWALTEFKQGMVPDRFMKERVSFVELAFREREQNLGAKARLTKIVIDTGLVGGTDASTRLRNDKSALNVFSEYRDELNERFRQARVPLSYHNGFVQFTTDEKLERNVVQPFWNLVAGEKWENVSIDMAEAVDRRDTGGRDPAFYAAKALESAIKIISDEKGWTRGVEKGASHYIDNLVVERSGKRFVEVWEKEVLGAFFGKVRNQLGHGPGGELMPNLTAQQTNWAIENAMSWCKSLIERP